MKQIKSVMVCEFKKDMRIMDIIDSFENGDAIHGSFFDTLLLRNVYKLKKGDYIYKVGLLIQDLNYKELEKECDLSFTSLKKEYGGKYWLKDSDYDPLTHGIYEGLMTVVEMMQTPDIADFVYDHYFELPIKLTAQSSMDRWSEPYGTALGDYAIIGARYETEYDWDW